MSYVCISVRQCFIPLARWHNAHRVDMLVHDVFSTLCTIWHPQWGGSSWAIGFTFGTGTLEQLGYNLVKVARWSTPLLGHNTSTWDKQIKHTRRSAIADKLPNAALRWMTAIYRPNFPAFIYHSPIWRPQWGGSPRAIGCIFGTGKLEWLGYNLVKVARW